MFFTTSAPCSPTRLVYRVRDPACTADGSHVHGKPEIQELVEFSDRLLRRSLTLHHERADAAKAGAPRTAALLAACMLLATCVALGVVWHMQRRVVSELGRAVRLRLSQQVAADNLGMDLAGNTGSTSDDEIGELVRGLSHRVERLRDTLQTVRLASDQIDVAAREIASGNTDLSDRTEQAASSLPQSASSMEQLTGTLRQTADSARTANQLASSASSVAQRGGEVVAQVVSTMDEINASSKKIDDSIGTIRRHRLPDQHSGAERRGRGGTRHETALFTAWAQAQPDRPEAALALRLALTAGCTGTAGW